MTKKIGFVDTNSHKQETSAKNHKPTMANKVARKQVLLTRKDIADWKWSERLFHSPTEPKSYLLQEIFADISNDALFTSQMNNRKEQTVSAPYEMVTPDDKIDDKMTDALRAIPVITDIIGYMIESEWFGNSTIELSMKNGFHKVELINRRNIVGGAFGRFYPDTSMNQWIPYREVSEYGKWILEFDADHIGMLNKAVPHILFKKFAQSCWSELCEIYGIPPRVMKTETRDPAMLDRAEEMMREVGAAAWFIIDSTEDFQFAQGVSTNGDVYNNLINLCNNETSMLVSGAIIGQDTKNGNESKEKTSIQIFDRLVDADKRMVETYMNSVVIPALYKIGWISSTTSRFRFSAIEDTDKLFTMVEKILPHKEVDNEWIEEKFGIKVTNKTVNFQ